MSRETIREVCACGARMDWQGEHYYAGERVDAFRADHRHIEPTAPPPDPTPLPEERDPAEELTA